MGAVVSAEPLDMLPEQAADFAALQAAAAEQEAEAAAMVGEEEQAGPDAAAETAAMFGAAVALLSPMLPYLPAIYTPERIEQLAGAYVPVAEKYGWSAGGWLDRFGAEIALVVVAGPMVVQTVGAHKAMRAEREREERARKAAAEVTPKAAPVALEAAGSGIVAGTVTFGQVAPA